MKTNIQDLLLAILKNLLKDLNLEEERFKDISLDFPTDSRFGDLSTNLALRLSKTLQKPCLDTAKLLLANLEKHLEKSPLKKYIREIKVEGAGFINFYLNNNYFYDELREIVLQGRNSLKINLGKKKPVLVEFVSANPTGSLSVAHARQAVVGDVLSNILTFLGFRVKREYYLNDEGNQINILGKSVELRLRQLSGEEVEFPGNYYQGEYIYDIARKVKSEKKKIKDLGEYSAEYILGIIKKELSDFGVRFDYWRSQKKLRKSGKIEKALDLFKKKGFLYEKEGALWFKSTQFGDDKDRVVVKSDGAYTYLAPDIAYHRDKYSRGFSWLINLWGPDHHGYINRLKAAVKALGKEPSSLTILIVQLVSIFREGRPLQMSTRQGRYITLREILNEVGADAARFFFLMRRISSHLDFDLEAAKKETPENPVYYVQYGYARICSILRNSSLKIKFKNLDLTLLKEKEELDLARKLWQFVSILEICANTQDPYLLTVYLQEVAETFHKFYDRHRVLGQEDKITCARLALIEATRTILGAGLELLGISMPEKM